MARILVAEDDDVNRELLKRTLTADGHEVSDFDNGADALSAYMAGPNFDLVITDVDMPNLNGLALAEKIISSRATQPVIIMSGIADELARARDLAGSALRLMNKPVTLEALRGTVTELLS